MIFSMWNYMTNTSLHLQFFYQGLFSLDCNAIYTHQTFQCQNYSWSQIWLDFLKTDFIVFLRLTNFVCNAATNHTPHRLGQWGREVESAVQEGRSQRDDSAAVHETVNQRHTHKVGHICVCTNTKH